MKILFVVLMFFVTSAFSAPLLVWDAVSTDVDGNPLGAGLEVTVYKVYRCGTSLSGVCFPKTLVGEAVAPAVQIDLVGEIFPQVYVVTAVNKIGESTDSVKIKATPAQAPKNSRFQ